MFIFQLPTTNLRRIYPLFTRVARHAARNNPDRRAVPYVSPAVEDPGEPARNNPDRRAVPYVSPAVALATPGHAVRHPTRTAERSHIRYFKWLAIASATPDVVEEPPRS